MDMYDATKRSYDVSKKKAFDRHLVRRNGTFRYLTCSIKTVVRKLYLPRWHRCAVSWIFSKIFHNLLSLFARYIRVLQIDVS